MPKFDFVEEIYKNDVDVDTIRYVEAYKLLNTFRDESEEEWSIECIINNYSAFLSFKDDLFLEKLINIYDEDELKEIIKEAKKILEEERVAEQYEIIDGDKKYKTVVN